MKFLAAFALLTVAVAAQPVTLPKAALPEVYVPQPEPIDFLPLMVPQEIVEAMKRGELEREASVESVRVVESAPVSFVPVQVAYAPVVLPEVPQPYVAQPEPVNIMPVIIPQAIIEAIKLGNIADEVPFQGVVIESIDMTPTAGVKVVNSVDEVVAPVIENAEVEIPVDAVRIVESAELADAPVFTVKVVDFAEQPVAAEDFAVKIVDAPLS